MEIHATSPQISCPFKRGTKYVIIHRQLVEDDISGEIIDSRYISPFRIVGRFIEIEILTLILGILELICMNIRISLSKLQENY